MGRRGAGQRGSSRARGRDRGWITREKESEQGAVEDCGGPGAQEGKAAAVSKDGCGQLARKAGLAAPGQAGLTALQIQATFGATEIESARGARAGEAAAVLPSHKKLELADQYLSLIHI